MAHIEFIEKIHASTKRDYLQRVVEHDKAACSEIAKKFGQEYWDGDRRYGYGGYRYDGRWRSLAQKLVDYYKLKPGDKVLDIGCGKGFLLYEFTQVVPGIIVEGIDISEYAVKNAKEEVKSFLRCGNAAPLPYPDRSFDFVVSINVLHNLPIDGLWKAFKDMQRVGKNDKKYIVLDSFRNEKERVNLFYWQLTCNCFYSPKEWEWIFRQTGYTGDYDFIYYE